MGYKFDSVTGKVDIRYPYDTAKGWIPYWNLNGKYVGMKFPSFDHREDIYRNSSTKKYVSTYEELNW